MPPPLRINNFKSSAYSSKASVAGGGLSSATSLATESDEDPFKYDKEKYKVFLQPYEEREVSRALRRFSDASVQSLDRYHPGAAQHESSLVAGPGENKQTAKAESTAGRNKRPDGNFYDSSVIKSDWALSDDPNEVKVPVNNNTYLTTGTGVRPNHGPQITYTAKYRSDSITQNHDGADDEGDWVTVATSAVGLDSGGPSDNYSRRGMRNFTPQETGSSIADISDDGSVREVQGNTFASTDRILQHPGKDELTGTRYYVRNIKETNRPVFVPKPHGYSVNGFPQNTTRFVGEPSKAPSFGRRLSKRFRRDASKAPTPSSSLAPFSRTTSDYNGYGLESSALANTEVMIRQTPPPPTSFGVPMLPSAPAPVYQGDSSIDGKHMLPYKLISLEEAQRLHAARRASGEGDETLPATPRRRDIRRMSLTGHGKPGTSSGPVIARSSIAMFDSSAILFGPNMPPHVPCAQQDDMGGRGAVGKFRTLPDSRLLACVTNISWPVHGFSPLSSSSRCLPATPGSINEPGNLPRLIRRAGTPLTYRSASSFRSVDTSTSLRRVAAAGIADLEIGGGGRRNLTHHANNYSWRTAAMHGGVSHTSQIRACLLFNVLAVLSILPFFALLVFAGTFNPLLSWLTDGQVETFTQRQRRVILAILFTEMVVYPAGTVALIVWYVSYHGV